MLDTRLTSSGCSDSYQSGSLNLDLVNRKIYSNDVFSDCGDSEWGDDEEEE
jgi:hypothetical protein